MKRFIMMLVCAVALCSGCTRFSSGDIEVYDAEHNGHDYIMFENCQCKVNK